MNDLRREYEEYKRRKRLEENPYVYCSCCGAKKRQNDEWKNEDHDDSCVWKD